MKYLLRRVAVTVVALAIAVIPSTTASASAPRGPCSENVNAGVASDGGSKYWGWCAPNGHYVVYQVTIHCPWGGGGTTEWASGEGGPDARVYTQSETCWFGAKADGWWVHNG